MTDDIVGRVLERLEHVADGKGDHQWEARCPAHDDRRSSLSVSVGDDGRVLLHCHAGCEPDAICNALGMQPAALFPPKKRRRKPAEIVACYNYRDEKGHILYQVCRLKPKDFRQRTPKPDGGWQWKVKGVRKVLYRLPEVLAADANTPIILCEGERDVDRLRKLGLTATCNAGGAGKWLTDYNAAFADRRVVLLPDNDQPGRDHAQLVARHLHETAAAIKIVELPELPDKGDVSDWLDAGNGPAELAAAIKATPAWEPPAQPESESDKYAQDMAICADLGLDVLGERPTQEILIYSTATRKLSEISKIGALNYPLLTQIAGPDVRHRVHRSTDGDPPPGSHALSRVVEAIASVGGRTRIYDGDARGSGIWPGKTGRLVIVGTGHAATWDHATGKLERVDRPRADGLLLDLHSSGPWVDFGKLEENLSKATDVGWRDEAYSELVALLNQWNWRNGREDAELLAAMAIGTYLQTCWRWRPHVALSSESRAGKSTLLEMLSRLFGGLAFLTSKPSEAGLRQAIRNRACAVLVDELESDRHRQRVLELLRTAGSGTKIVRGTSSQHGIEYGLKHMVWIAAIESGLIDQADRNRYLKAEFRPPEERHRRAFRVPPEHELRHLGDRLLAIAVRYSGEALDAAESTRRLRPEGIDTRIVDSLSVPVATTAAVMGMDTHDCNALEGVLVRFAATIDQDDLHVESDQQQLMHAILSSIVELGKGDRLSVAQAIARGEWDALERVGVTVACDTPGRRPTESAWDRDWLFFDHRNVCRHLLAGTRYSSQSIDQVLLRLDGAVRMQIRINGRRPRGVAVPWGLYSSEFANEDSEQMF